MVGQGLFSWFGSSKQEEAPQTTWDPKTLTMVQPQSPERPTTEDVVTDQPAPKEDMHLQLRGGDGPGDE
ncbi:uncharacterized protein CDV56_105286 [Aspergillus thermomutatus]|uniref:Uncharacterized protein n=1 Tax=Aspergillus thermomutatus TaxID=41047 RepID=A0A397GWP6_ASPTH|nr:uncharacterized protein CDV56_105286 [Aspergillus thermomutatus]RHZ55412.1 hypothetical protein CDV56_105286 [Aspergillus thermomutatus]